MYTAPSLRNDRLQLFQTALAGSSCSSLYSSLDLVMGVQYIEEEEEE